MCHLTGSGHLAGDDAPDGSQPLNNMKKIIGLVGYAGAGKDEAAKALIDSLGFVKVSFAEPLRTALSALDPIVGTRFLADGVHQYIRYNEAISEYGYDEAKRKFPEVREQLQKFGTEVGRQQFGEEFWVDQAKRLIDAMPDDARIVITDVRFPNEAKLIRKLGGFVIRVDRPGVGPVNDHVSDSGIGKITPDALLLNNTTIDDLHTAANALACEFLVEWNIVPNRRLDVKCLQDFVQPSLFSVDL